MALLQDHFGLSRKTAVLIIGALGTLVALCIQGLVAAWMDFISIYLVPLGAALAGIMFAWVWGRQKIEQEVSKGRHSAIGSWYYPLYKYVFCIITIVVFACGIIFQGIG